MTAPLSSSLRSWPGRASLVAVVAVGAGALTLLPGAATPAAAAGLVPFGDCDALVDHYRTQLARGVSAYGVGPGGPVGLSADLSAASGDASTAVAAAPQAARMTTESSAGSGAALDAVGNGPTGTNVQERGVDEPDVVKAVGDLLYVAARGRLQLLRAGAEPELLSSLPLGGDGAPAELLVDGDRVLALVSGWRAPVPVPSEPDPKPVDPPTAEPLPVEPEPLPVEPLPLPVTPPSVEPLPEPAQPLPVDPPVEPVPGAAPDVVQPRAVLSSPVMPAPGNGFVQAVLVDVADPASPRVLETLELDGRYVSARLVDGAVRLVTSSSPQVPVTTPAEPWGPASEEAALRENQRAVERLTAEQVVPTAVQRDADGEVVQQGPAVDCADVHYAGREAVGSSTLLVTTLRPAQGLTALDSTAVTTDGDLVYASLDRLYVATSRWGSAGGGRTVSGEPTTELHAFDTSTVERTPYLGSGSVRGFVQGRWALSEHEGDLRVATTLPAGPSSQSSSSIAVLSERDGGLVEVGRVDGLGPDEQVYAVRYFGDLATVVTFRQTDPLYVVDLADPTRPRVLGELKIPGFSTYLHPIGDDRLLGVGQDADPATGRVTGFQVSLFDLSDRSSPVQVDRLSLGPGWSPASEDSRAVSYDPLRRLLALPFGDERGQSSALGVRVDGDRLVEAGRMSMGAQWLQRTLLHDGRVFAVTEGSVVAGDADAWARTGAAALAG